MDSWWRPFFYIGILVDFLEGDTGWISRLDGDGKGLGFSFELVLAL